jgi:hypothetical protein
MVKVRTELEEAIIDMFYHLHMFQYMVATIINQHGRVQNKLTQFNTIQEGMNNIDTWITEISNSLVELYRPSAMCYHTKLPWVFYPLGLNFYPLDFKFSLFFFV